MNCGQAFHLLHVGARIFGTLLRPKLIQFEQSRVAEFARNDFGPCAWRSRAAGGCVGPLVGRSLDLLRLICFAKGCKIGPHSRDW